MVRGVCYTIFIASLLTRFCSFDSEPEAAVMTAHTAFVDPSTPETAPPRESIELRALLFY